MFIPSLHKDRKQIRLEFDLYSPIPQCKLLSITPTYLFLLTKADVKLFSSWLNCKFDLFHKIKTAADLKNDLPSVVNWGKKVRVNFKRKKNKQKLISFNRRKVYIFCSMSIADVDVQQSDKFRLLGQFCSHRHEVEIHIESIARSASRKVVSLCRQNLYHHMFKSHFLILWILLSQLVWCFLYVYKDSW